MGWQVRWQLFNREEWLRARPDAELDLDYWEQVVENSLWASVQDVLADQPRAHQEGGRIWFVLRHTGVRIGTELDFFHRRVWVREIEPY